MNNILKCGRFDLVTRLEEDDHDPSGSNQDGINEITFDMISALQFRIPSITLDKKNINKIYCDNGGSFYKYKINKTFENCIPLRITLLRYQITNELNKDMINKKFKKCELLKEELLRCKNMFKYNCITWALKMSCKFNETTIENIASFSYHRYVSHKELQEFGDKFNIAFKVLKYRKDKNDCEDITSGKKVIGSNKLNAIKINLALIAKHYILNEELKGINKFALNHYNEIKQTYPNKNDKWILNVYNKSGK